MTGARTAVQTGTLVCPTTHTVADARKKESRVTRKTDEHVSAAAVTHKRFCHCMQKTKQQIQLRGKQPVLK